MIIFTTLIAPCNSFYLLTCSNLTFMSVFFLKTSRTINIPHAYMSVKSPTGAQEAYQWVHPQKECLSVSHS